MSCRVADHAMFDGGQWFESPLEHTIKIDNFFTKAAISLKLLKSSKLLKFKSQNYKTSCKTVNKLACGAPLLPTQSRVSTAYARAWWAAVFSSLRRTWLSIFNLYSATRSDRSLTSHILYRFLLLIWLLGHLMLSILCRCLRWVIYSLLRAAFIAHQLLELYIITWAS